MITLHANDEEPIAADALSLVVTVDLEVDADGETTRTRTGKLAAESTTGWRSPTRSASEPAVLQFADYTPAYVMHATVLAGSGDATPAAATLYSPPNCLAPIVYDAAGHRTVLPEWCPSSVASPPADVDEDAHDEPSRSSVSPNPSE